MRKYEPIWNQLKIHGEVSLLAPIESHSRIVKAVRKEKWRDAGWRLLRLEESNSKYELIDTIEDSKITFKLIKVHTLLSGLL